MTNEQDKTEHQVHACGSRLGGDRHPVAGLTMEGDK